MKKLHSLCLTLLFSFILANFASAAPLDSYRLATIDINRILNELGEAKAKKAELDKRSAGARDKIEKEQKALQSLEQSLKQKKVANDSKEAEDFRNKAREFQRLVKDSEEDMRREFLKINKALTDRVIAAVQEYSKKNSVQLVLDKGSPGRSPLLFGDPSADITNEILAQLNSR